MGYSIQPVQIWNNGTNQTGNYINAVSVYDDFATFADFTYQISSVIVNEENTTTTQLISGNLKISGADYTAWGESQDINLAAYQYICTQLNLTLIP